MHLNADFSKRAVVRSGDVDWVASPLPGVERMMLDSVALVRWAAGTRFNRHRHFGGEEILVLEGTFQDEHGDYPAGSWLRSPHLSEHAPFSDDGCLIYVKVGHLARYVQD